MTTEHRVLLIEDNDVDAAVFARFVEAMPGWTVDRVSSLEAAEERAETVGSRNFCLVAVDLTLPDAMDLEAVEFAVEAFPRAVCVAVTARDPDEVDERALRAGAADLLVKGQMNARGVQRAVSHAVERNELVRRQLDSERNLRRLLGAWSDALFVVGDNDLVLFRNDAAATFTDALTRTEGDNEELLLRIEPGELLQQDVVRPGGESVPVEIRAWSLTWADRPARVVVLRDRRAERAAERALELMEQAETRAHLGEGALAGVHDIGNRITAMLGMLHEVDTMVSQLTEEPSRTRLSNLAVRLRESTEHVADIVRDTKRPVAAMVRGRVELATLVRSCCRAMRPDLERAAALRLALEPAAEVVGDPSALRRVIDNLLSNAIQAIGPDQAQHNEIRVTVRQAGGQVILEVDDTGPGIPGDVLPHVFDQHFSTKSDGTGLGLPTCRKVVGAHGGTIQVESRSGMGTTVRVSLPAMRARSGDVRLLLLEDRPEVARANKRLLGERYKVELAADGRQALDLLAHDAAFQVILCDLDMPDIDGREFFERLKTDHPELVEQVIFCSGGATSEEVDGFLKRADRPCLPKPIDLNEAIPMIESIADRARARVQG